MIAPEMNAFPGEHFGDFDWPRSIARGIGAAVALLGAIVLLGWIVDSSLLKSGLTSGAEMKVNTSLCFLLAGAALLVAVAPNSMGRRSGFVVASFAIMALGLASAIEHVAAIDLGIDVLEEKARKLDMRDIELLLPETQRLVGRFRDMLAAFAKEDAPQPQMPHDRAP